MLRPAAVAGTILFLVVPATAAGLIPWWITGWSGAPVFGAVGLGLGVALVVGLGAVLVAAGVVALLESFARFVRQGEGTPAPVAPTRRLVTGGLYRYVRNPIYLAVLAVILGQALLFGSGGLLLYAGVVWLAFHLFVVLHEEPTLARTFGEEYADYRAAVPRWLPRLRPWRE